MLVDGREVKLEEFQVGVALTEVTPSCGYTRWHMARRCAGVCSCFAP